MPDVPEKVRKPDGHDVDPKLTMQTSPTCGTVTVTVVL